MLLVLVLSACGRNADSAAPERFEWGSARPSAAGSALIDRLHSPESVAQETAVAEAQTILMRRCMTAEGFQFPAPSIEALGGLYHVSPHYWEIEKWLEDDPDSAMSAEANAPMDRYLRSLSAKEQAAFDKAQSSGATIAIDVFGQKVTQQAGGCFGSVDRALWGDQKAHLRSVTVWSNASSQAEQRVGEDPKFLAAAAKFKRCATEAGMANVLYEEGALNITPALGASAREVALRCDGESQLTKVGQARFHVAEAAFATYYEQDLRRYLTMLAAANTKALRVIGGS